MGYKDERSESILYYSAESLQAVQSAAGTELVSVPLVGDMGSHHINKRDSRTRFTCSGDYVSRVCVQRHFYFTFTLFLFLIGGKVEP